MNETDNSHITSRHRMIGLLLLCVLLMLTVWYVSSIYIENSEKISAHKTLTSIGQLKVDQIQSYLADHHQDASVIAELLKSPSAQHWLMHRGANAPAELCRLTELVVKLHQYRELLILDADANIRFSTAQGGILNETGKSIALRSMRERTPYFYQIYFGDPAEPDRAVLDVFVPILDADGTKSAGMVVLRDNPDFLFDLIQTWPVESETAETMLVTKDGSDVLFLNDHRHQKNTALKLRVPLSDDPKAPARPAIAAVTGHLGLLEANDYHGKRVLAYTLAVPDTQWGMVVKMDVEEATRRSRVVQTFTAMALAAILGMAGMIVWTWWRKNETLHEMQMMLETSGEGFWKTDLSGHIIETNDAYCRLIGYGREEVVGAHVSKFSVINTTPGITAGHIRRVMEQGFDRFESRHRHRDGHLIDIEVVASFVPETKCILSFLHDTTARKLAEALIFKSDAKYHRLYESMRDAFVMVDMKGRLIEFNSAYREMLGYSAEELHNLTYVDLTPQKWHEFEMRIVAEQILPSGQSEVYEKEYIRKDGTVFPVELRTFLLNDKDNQPEAMWAIVRDITERKHARNLLRVAATAFETHEGITITDTDANIIRVNRSFEKITGYRQEEVIGTNPRFLHSGRQDDAFYAEMWRQLLGNGTWSGEIWNKRKNGEIYPEWLTITAVKNEQGETTEYVGVFSDITLRKETEEKLRKHNAELEAINLQLNDAQNLLLQSDKMASVGQLAAGVAHEINNPIGYVSSNLWTLDEYIKELLELVAACEEIEGNIVADNAAALAQVKAAKDKIDLNFLKEDIPALMNETQEGLLRVKKIVQDLKDFSRVDSTEEWQRANLHKGLDSTLNVASNEIKYKAEIRKEYGNIPEVECVISQLNQVFMNLLVNAAHAIEKRGIITVRTGQQGEEVWVEIADTGKGIAPEHLNKIFDPFFTTKPVGKGTGLGLSLSYGIIQKHHGRIEVNSELGRGTTFRIWLPVKQPENEQAL